MRSLITVFVMVLPIPGAFAQYATDFEPPSFAGSPEGTVLTGQEGWYLPEVGGTDQFVFAYDGNIIGLEPHPSGGTQFIGGTDALKTHGRADHAVDFGADGEWEVCYDMAVTAIGHPSPTLCSVSFQPDGTRRFIKISNFMDNDVPENGWRIEYNVYDADNKLMDHEPAGPEFTYLVTNRWYRVCTTVDFSSNRVTRVSAEDLTTGAVVSTEPAGWYLYGGDDPVAFPKPTAIRFFVGDGLGGDRNMAGIDNLTVVPIGDPPCYPDFTGDGTLDLFDFLGYVNAFNAQDPEADCDGDGSFSLFDFLCFVNAFNKGC